MQPEGAQPSDAFYVGYFPVPRSLRAKLWIIVPAVMAACGALGFAIGKSQHGAGTGAWDTESIVERTGVLVERPYPMIVPEHAGESGATLAMPILLVQSGKRGAAPRVQGLDGKVVRVRGYSLRRATEARVSELLELADGADAIASLSEGRQHQDAALGAVTLSGEIVDSKCYHGAMKPGEGKTHKACATLCVRGGIPPSLVVWDGDKTTLVLLAGADGGPIEERWLEYVGDMVEVKGRASTRAGLMVVRVESVSRQ
jgi:hypothetical protein